MRFAVILACHNRSAFTVRALRTVHASIEAAGHSATYTLFDDGSTDGTAEAVDGLELQVDRIEGDGDTFWAGGMSRAESRAFATTPDADAVLWLNDDVEVDLDAIRRLSETARTRKGAIVVGSVREPDGSVSYSGYASAGIHPLRLREVLPTDGAQELDTFNGNLVLVPKKAADLIGLIDGDFAHQLADIDYGYRARRVGVPILLAPGTFGSCPTNPPRVSRGARADWQAFLSPKGGGHAKSMQRFLRRHAGRSWPLWMAQTYALWWVRALTRRRRPAS